MGIKSLIKELPGGTMGESLIGFSKLPPAAAGERRVVDIDTGGLVYVCAYRCKETFNRGDYEPAAREFQRMLVVIKLLHGWDHYFIFDGVPPAEKSHEHQRRRAARIRSWHDDDDDDENPDSVSSTHAVAVTSEFIAICAKICQRQFANYVVAPSEADMQVGRLCGREEAVAVCNDGDLIAYGRQHVVFVSSWAKESYRYVDMTVPLTDEVAEKYPLYALYCRFGLRVIHYWAAIMGCDISVDKSGIRGAGRSCFFSAMAGFKGRPDSEFTSKHFAREIHRCAQSSVRLAWGLSRIKSELDRVSTWFVSGGSHYDADGNIISLDGATRTPKSRSTVRHMRGDLNPRTGTEFTAEQRRCIDGIQSHNLQQNSSARRDVIRGLSLPSGRDSVRSCTVAELKQMMTSRAATLTGADGKPLNSNQLQMHMAAYLSLESERKQSSVFFNRAREGNGVFVEIDTSERRSVRQIVRDLFRSDEFDIVLSSFFREVLKLLNDEEFTDNFNTIALSAPELQDKFIYATFIHVGENTEQKNIGGALQRVQEMDTILYHANATSADGKYLFIVSKQRASQTRDEKTRNKTDAGEKPKLREYLVLMKLLVSPTTVESHGHTLGVVVHVIRSYCALCNAGAGLCIHQAECLWMQHLHWGEGRPTPKPPTSSYCAWFPGSRGKRSCSTILPATRMNIERLPKSNAEAEAKLRRGRKGILKEGLDARYDVFGDEKKWALLNSQAFVRPVRFERLYRALEIAQSADVKEKGDSDEDSVGSDNLSDAD